MAGLLCWIGFSCSSAKKDWSEIPWVTLVSASIQMDLTMSVNDAGEDQEGIRLTLHKKEGKEKRGLFCDKLGWCEHSFFSHVR